MKLVSPRSTKSVPGGGETGGLRCDPAFCEYLLVFPAYLLGKKEGIAS